MCMNLFIIIASIIGVLIIWALITYNTFVRFVERGKEAWADIDVQLKRRYDLIPNLINTVKAYALHEAKVFENVTKARNMAMSAGNLTDKSEAENILSGALKSLFAVAEAYPDLKANQNFMQLQNELADTENKIQASRRFYNTVVRDLNTKIDSLPDKIIASMFSFIKMEYFELENEEAKEPVVVKFD